MLLLYTNVERRYMHCLFLGIVLFLYLVELRKQSSCFPQLTNKTDQCTTFKVRTTIPMNSYVHRVVGIVVRGSACDITASADNVKKFNLPRGEFLHNMMSQ